MNFLAQNRWVLSVGTFVSLCFLFFVVSFATAFAQNAVYTPLVGIPGLATGQGTGLASYLNRLYIITIGIGAILAFIKISMAGVKWSMSDVITDKGAAKEDIKGALLGLAILLIPYIVLNTIYPGLTSLNILENAGSSRVDLNRSSTATYSQSTANTGTNSGTGITTGTVYRDYSFDCTTVSPVTNEFEAINPQRICDDTLARSNCASVNGTFTVTGPDTGRCAFVEAAPPSTAACALGGPCY